MTGSWLGFVVSAGVAVAGTIWVYRHRELPVPGRAGLAALRSGILVLVILLLFDPRLPARNLSEGADAWVLVDASSSLAAVDSTGLQVWQEAVRRARAALGENARLVLFGDGVEPIASAALDSVTPFMTSSRLAPALNRAAEAGVNTLTVVSDLRLEDPSGAVAALDRLGLGVSVEQVGDRIPNAGVARFEVPAALDQGDSVQAEVVVRVSEAEVDSFTVEIREEGRLVGSAWAGLPPAGRDARIPFVLPPAAEEGAVLYAATVRMDGDAFAGDDTRLGIVRVADEVGGIVLVSVKPDWEPRFLLPVLAQVSGLPARGYLALADGRFLPMGSVDEDAAPVDEEEVRDRAGQASLLVVHGLSGSPPEWLLRLVQTAPRALILAEDAGGAALAGVAVTPPQSGEWYAPADPPPSPLSGELTDIAFTGLPPLSGLLPLLEPDPRAPLVVQRQGLGASEAAIVLREGGGRRYAVAVAQGFWRWAFRDGEPRNAYRRVWASVVGWILREDPASSGAGVAPASNIVIAGVPIVWRAPGRTGDTLRIRISPPQDGFDTTVVVGGDGGFRTRALSGGDFRFLVESRGDTVSAGRIGVETFTDDLLHAAVDPATLERVSSRGIREGARGLGRPIRTHPLPYLLVLVLLSLEWIGRRRRGLR